MTHDPRRRYLPAPSSLSKHGLSLAIQSAVALALGVSQRLYVVIPGVLFSALALAGDITGKSVLLAPHYFWLLVAVAAVGGGFLQYHHERVVRIAHERRANASQRRAAQGHASPL